MSARLWILLSLCCLARPALGVEVPATWTFPAGATKGALQLSGKAIPVGTLLAVGFRAEHAARIDKVDITFGGSAGPVELHAWRDNGGNQPGAPEGLFTDAEGADRMAPRVVQASVDGNWQSIDLGKDAIDVAPLDLVWIGVRITKEGPSVAMAELPTGMTLGHAIVQTTGDPCADGCGVPGELLIRASGVYIDPLPAARWFADVTSSAGVTSAGRMAWGDYDKDGDQDLLLGGNGLWQNDGKGHFSSVTTAAGLDAFGNGGGLWGDFDNDGWLDIFTFGGRERLLRNLGNGTFAEVKTADFQESPTRDFPTEAAAWVDIDLDGRLDVYTANYETMQKDAQGADILGVCDVHLLWHNNGDGTFTEQSEALGLHPNEKHCGRSVAAVDWDQDGDLDIYVGNYRLDPNFFFRNDFPPVHFSNIAHQNGTVGIEKQGAFGHTIGATWADTDNDGDFDLFVSNLAHPRYISFSNRSMFYQNLGKEGEWGFSEHREQTGIGYLETHSNPNFGDVDNDGNLDLTLTAVYEGRRGQLWHGDGKAADPSMWLHYSDATYAAGWTIDNGWGSAFADMDGDGDLDQMVNKLLRNDYAAVTGKAGHWLEISLQGGGKVNRAAIGAWATVKTADGVVRSRAVSGGQGLGCQDALVLHYGLGDQTVVQQVTVHWPGAPTETFGPFAVDQRVEVTVQQGAKGEAPAPPAPDAGSTPDGVQQADVHADASAPPSKANTASGCVAARADRSGAQAFLLLCWVVLATHLRRRRAAR